MQPRWRVETEFGYPPIALPRTESARGRRIAARAKIFDAIQILNATGQSSFNQARIEWAIRLRFSPMPRLDPEIMSSQLNAFRIGELRVVGKTWECQMERDGELAVNATKRASDLAALPYNIVSDGSPDGDKHAEALTYFYKHARATKALDQDSVGGVSDLLRQIASAHSYYYSAHEILLRVDNPAANEVTAEFRHTPVWFFESRRGYLAYLKHIFDVYGQPCVQGEWLTCVGEGWMRPLSMAFCIKAFGLRDWNIWCSRYASGFLEGVVDEAPGSTAWQEALGTLQAMANDGAVLHSPKVVLKFLEQAARTGMPFKELVDLVNSLYAKCYRGVDLATSSKSGGSSAGNGGGASNVVGASVQSEESGIYLASDALWATGYLNDRVDRPIVRYLFDQEPRAAISVTPPPDDTSDEDLQALKALVPMGWRIAMKDVYKRFRWEAPSEGEPCLTAPVQAAPGNEGDPESAPVKPAPAAAPANPKTADETQEQTQPAKEDEAAPIGAGADPASLGQPQTASPQMPDPQVDAAGFWSSAGAAMRSIFGPFISGKKIERNTDGTLPAAAYSIANEAAPRVSEEFEQASREQLAEAVRGDLAHAAAKVGALLQISDPDHFASRAKNVLEEWDAVTANTLMAPKAADSIAPMVGTAYLSGLRSHPALGNWDPDQPRDNLGRWVDENGGGLSVRDNIKRGAKARDLALRQKADVQKAMYRKGAGQIDFPYGRPGTSKANEQGATHADGYGLSHMADKHPDQLKDLPVTIAKGRVVPHDKDASTKLYIVHKDNVAVLKRGNAKQAWAVTHLEDPAKVELLKQKSRPSWMTGK